jgi:hypothetical protein
MRKLIDKLAVWVAAKPREAAIAILVLFAWASVAGIAFLLK